MNGAYENTDRELWRAPDVTGNGSFYSDRVHVTAGGGIGMNVGGYVIVMRPKEWHAACKESAELRTRLDGAEAEIARLRAALNEIAIRPGEDDEWL